MLTTVPLPRKILFLSLQIFLVEGSPLLNPPATNGYVLWLTAPTKLNIFKESCIFPLAQSFVLCLGAYL